AVRESRARLVYAVIAAILAAAAVASASRAGSALVLLELLVVPWLAMRRGRDEPGPQTRKRRAQLVGQLLAFGLVSILIVGWGVLRDRLDLLQPLVVRRELLISSFHMFLD